MVQDKEVTQARDLKRIFSERGQEHLFAHWAKREETHQKALLKDLQDIDLDQLKSLQQAQEVPKPMIEPVPYQSPYERENAKLLKAYRREGEKVLSDGQAGFLLVAGGQGSRLGLTGPKGLFPITPLQGHSLFQLFAEKILASRIRYNQPMYWYIMTSPLNHQTILDYFELNRFFGLPAEEVFFFPQGMLPSLDKNGRLVLGENGGLFRNPDGHGGTLSALHKAGLFEHMKQNGIEDLFYFQVDNPLVNIPDPLFLGVHRQLCSEMSTKIIEKAFPEEKLGNIGKLNGRPGVLEYSDLDSQAMHARGKDGKLLFSHGSIAIHILNRAFVECLDRNLPLHQACKTVNCFVPGREGGEIISREILKYERFIFDAIPIAANPLFWETNRREEFAPLKNRTGVDSIETCKAGLIDKYACWLERCGLSVPRDDDGHPRHLIEIAPLYALDDRALKNRLGDTVNSINEDTLFS